MNRRFVLEESEFDLLVELRDLADEIATRAERVIVVRQLLADVRRQLRELDR